MNKILQFYNKNLFLIWIILTGIVLRIIYLLRKSGDLFIANLGGDPCYHYNVASNIANGLGPKTSFIFSYWFYHPEIPAYTDLYGPGYAAFLSLFILFNDNFINLRLANFLIGFLSILISYFIGKKIHSKQLGLISAFFISLNFFHIENSTVVMREIFTLLLTQLFFLVLFYLNFKKKLIFLIGLIVGYISITTGIWPIYILIFYLYLIFYLKKNFFNFTVVFVLGFLTTSIHWIVITKQYFGKFYYSNLDFYPYVSGWSRMMLDKGFPEVNNFWKTIDYQEYLSNHFFWFINNLYKGSLFLTPTFIYFVFFLLLPICFYGAVKLKKNGFLLLFFSIVYFFGLSFASNALSGNLWPRHFLPLLGTISLLLGSGMIPILDKVHKRYLNLKNYRIIFSTLFISFLITVVGIESKTSYWEKDDKNFYKFGQKIKKVTSNESVIMYSVAVPDVWCSTGRKVVHDIAFAGDKVRHRLKSEIDKYSVSHIFIDLSEENYNYSEERLKKLLKNYQNQELKEIIKDKENGYFFYEIKKN
jgi:hypothetical protein